MRAQSKVFLKKLYKIIDADSFTVISINFCVILAILLIKFLKASLIIVEDFPYIIVKKFKVPEIGNCRSKFVSKGNQLSTQKNHETLTDVNSLIIVNHFSIFSFLSGRSCSIEQITQRDEHLYELKSTNWFGRNLVS